MSRTITARFEDDLATAIDTAAKAAGESRTAWLEQAARRRLEYGDQPPPAARAGHPGTDSLAARMHRANTPRHVASSAQAKHGIQPITKTGAK